MAQTMMERIKVKNLSKYGFQAESGEYVNWAPKLNESERGKVVPGGEYEFDLFVSDGGKKYVNKVTMVALANAAPVAQKKAPETAKSLVKQEVKTDNKAQDSMSKSEWQAKDRSQLIGGLSHDAAMLASCLAGLNGTQEEQEILKSYHVLLVGMLKIRDEVK